jgi:D-alanyl-D-alanine carboxypeptidase
MNQTSGIPNPAPVDWFHLYGAHENHDENKVLQAVLKENAELDFEPGEKYQYSNISYWLLGKVIESVSGEKYTEYVTQNIFVPVGINKSEVSFLLQNKMVQAKEYHKRFSPVHFVIRMMADEEIIGENEKKWKNMRYVYHNGAAYGGLYGNARGMAKILKDLLNENSILLSKEMKTAFFTQQKNNNNELIETTLGCHTGIVNGVKYYGKVGGGVGSHGNIRIYPKKGIATALFVNQMDVDADSINAFSNFLDGELLKN